jgi:predicted ATPase/class 3 adenylate cyclase
VSELPTGTVTFLFTDLEGSTRLWDQQREAMEAALARHDAILRESVESFGGHVVKGTGDGLHAVFATAEAAVEAGLTSQLELDREVWGATGPLRVRMGLHSGTAERRGGDYFGPVLNRAARLMGVAHPGQVLCSQTTADLVADSLPEGVGLVALGEHRLRDLSRPEQVFQLTHPGLERLFPPPLTLDATPSNLPVQLTSFVGREAELASVARMLEHARLVTITGVGGVGKTRLALQVAAEVLPRFVDGVWVCELAAAGDPEAMIQVVAATLGVSPRAEMSLAGSVREYLASKQLLVVLDNCEHLLGEVARLAESVLRECAQVRILATSREGLAVTGEQLVALPSLGLPAGSEPDAVAASEAARLFAERAAAARAGFGLDRKNAAAVGEICRRLDGIPLAIELAAARVVGMRPAEIATRLDERFRLLTGGRRTAVERQQTLRATVEWSYSLLEPLERLAFDRLGVFAGSFDATAAEAVVAGEGLEGWDVVEALTSLVGKSMLVDEEGVEGRTRYVILETLRAYARERLEAVGETDAWRRRHARHFVSFAEEVGPLMRGADQLVAQQAIRAELDNLRAAVTWALDARADADAELAIRIIAALLFHATTVSCDGVSTWAERAAPRADVSTPGRRLSVLAGAAWNAWMRGDMELARAHALDALRDGLPTDAIHDAFIPYFILARTLAHGDDVERALDVLAEARRALDAVGADPVSTLGLLITSSTFRTQAGELMEARGEALEAIDASRELGNPSSLSSALFALGLASWRLEPSEALAALDEGIALMRTIGQTSTLGHSLALAAVIRARFGDRIGALSALREAIEQSYDIGDRPQVMTSLERGVPALIALAEPEPACILGGLTSGPLAEFGIVPRPDRDDTRQSLDELRAQLGAERFEELTTRGRALAYDEAVSYSLRELDELLGGGPARSAESARR